VGSTLFSRMVDRFLCWKLPKDFAPDHHISFDRGNSNLDFDKPGFWPIGTNLLTADQAAEMLRAVVLQDEDALQLMENTAAMLRGMTMDPSIPAHAKGAMRSQISELEAMVEQRLSER
jgi:hypothetical protein